MDFFQHQERARRNTGLLVILFILAVVGTVVAVNLAVVPFVAAKGGGPIPTIAVVTVCVLGVILVGTLIKVAQMSGGGKAVAEALGGRPVDPSSRDPDERRALNVVEEMAIASGMPVPPIYILDDDAINAFAAGRTPADSVIGLTRGCVQTLSRDELQGVVAHEFSHIFNQDTRLNMRLVGLLGGILALAIVGQVMLRSMRHSSRRNKEAGAAIFIGLALLIVGYIGYFFGRLIQCAVCRQREFLADASAVQYTRNPDGLAGALERIARGRSTALDAPRAGEFSHFFFASGLNSLFSTHPDAEERIRRIRALPLGAKVGGGADKSAAPPAYERANPALTAAFAAGAIPGPPPISSVAVRDAAQEIGALSPGQIDYAAELIAELPRELVSAAHDPFAARAVVIGLLLSPHPGMSAMQLGLVQRADARLHDALARLAPLFGKLRPAQRLPLLELCSAPLAMLSPHQYAEFRSLIEEISHADGEVDRFEWIVRVILRRAIERRGSREADTPTPTTRDVALVTSVLCYSGARSIAEASNAWRAARGANAALPAEPLPTSACTLDAVDASLRALDGASPGVKRSTINGCVAAVCADGVTTEVEAELLRAFSAGMGAPMPPVRR